MKRRLSSIITLAYKSVPFFSAGLFGIGLPDLIREPGGIIILAIGVFIMWCGFWYLFTRRWKSVSFGGEVLYVSDYLKRIEIPISEIKDVEVSSWFFSNPRTITLTLKTCSGFGKEIVFVPRFIGFDATIIADELRSLIKA